MPRGVRVRPPLPVPARRKRHIACDELFHFMAKLIARSFCCSSLPNRSRFAGLRFGCRRCAAVLSIIERISILAIPSTSEQALYRLLRLFSKVRACSRLKAGISLYTSPQICYISLIIDHNFTGSDAVSGGSPVQGRRSLTSTVCAHGVQARSPGGVLTSALRWRDWVTAPVPVRSLPLGEGVFSREGPSLPISLI